MRAGAQFASTLPCEGGNILYWLTLCEETSILTRSPHGTSLVSAQLQQQQQMEAFSIFTMHFSSGAPFPVNIPNKVCTMLFQARGREERTPANRLQAMCRPDYNMISSVLDASVFVCTVWAFSPPWLVGVHGCGWVRSRGFHFRAGVCAYV